MQSAIELVKYSGGLGKSSSHITVGKTGFNLEISMDGEADVFTIAPATKTFFLLDSSFILNVIGGAERISTVGTFDEASIKNSSIADDIECAGSVSGFVFSG